MNVYGYARVSTGRQAEDGESLGTQSRIIGGYAAMKDMPGPVMFVESGVSGSIKFNDRLQGRRLLDQAQAGDVIIVPKLDRAFRSALDALDVLAQLQARKVELHIIDLGGDVCNNAISKLVFTILAAVAEGERDRIRERVREVKADQRKRGRYLGGTVPAGKHVTADGFIAPSDALADHVAFAQELRAARVPLREIAKRLTANGLAVSHVTVKRLLDREKALLAA